MEGKSQCEQLNERLDEALEESFPASDPPAVHRRDRPPANAEDVHPYRPIRRDEPSR